jgi:ferredoxin
MSNLDARRDVEATGTTTDATTAAASGVRLRIWVDPDKCQGHSRCYGLLPELFDVDDYGLSTVKGDGYVPTALIAKARLAIANCPEGAIEELPPGGSDD